MAAARSVVTYFVTTSCVLLSLVTCACDVKTGATEALSAVLMGRCIQYRTLVNPEAVCPPAFQMDCTEVVSAFVEGFAGKDPCNITMPAYTQYLDRTRYSIPMDKSMFWSSIHDLAQRYSASGRRLIVLESTLTGYLVDGLHFCPDRTVTGRESRWDVLGVGNQKTEFCPSFYGTTGCRNNAEFSFWAAASRDFAMKAQGTITVMLNASRTDPYRDASFFGTWEIPNLRVGVVKHANIWMIHEPGRVKTEDCEGDSVKLLQKRLSARNITSSCLFNPRSVTRVLFADSEGAGGCSHQASSASRLLNPLFPTLLFFLSTLTHL